MPRNRLIQSNYWSDDKIIKISVEARLLFIALWTFSDDMGIHRNDNNTIKARAFPIDKITTEDIERIKNELLELELILSFKDDTDGKLLFIKNWYKYQTINKPTPSKYKLPPHIIENFNDDELAKYNSRVIPDNYRNSVVGLHSNRKEKNRIKKIESNEYSGSHNLGKYLINNFPERIND